VVRRSRLRSINIVLNADSILNRFLQITVSKLANVFDVQTIPNLNHLRQFHSFLLTTKSTLLSFRQNVISTVRETRGVVFKLPARPLLERRALVPGARFRLPQVVQSVSPTIGSRLALLVVLSVRTRHSHVAHHCP